MPSQPKGWRKGDPTRTGHDVDAGLRAISEARSKQLRERFDARFWAFMQAAGVSK